MYTNTGFGKDEEEDWEEDFDDEEDWDDDFDDDDD